MSQVFLTSFTTFVIKARVKRRVIFLPIYKTLKLFVLKQRTKKLFLKIFNIKYEYFPMIEKALNIQNKYITKINEL